MAIRFYDDAVATKINNWLPKDKNRKIQVLKPDEVKRLFEIEADEKKDKPLSLPLIAISRDTTIDIIQPTMTPMSFDGMMIESDGVQTIQLDAIPISLSYQLDIYTKRFDEGDELLREFIFKIVNHPQLVIDIPYNNQKLKYVTAIKLQSQVEDTSDISQRLFPGQFTRWTLRFDVDRPYLFSVPLVNNVSMDAELEVVDNNLNVIELEEK